MTICAAEKGTCVRCSVGSWVRVCMCARESACVHACSVHVCTCIVCVCVQCVSVCMCIACVCVCGVCTCAHVCSVCTCRLVCVGAPCAHACPCAPLRIPPLPGQVGRECSRDLPGSGSRAPRPWPRTSGSSRSADARRRARPARSCPSGRSPRTGCRSLRSPAR